LNMDYDRGVEILNGYPMLV